MVLPEEQWTERVQLDRRRREHLLFVLKVKAGQKIKVGCVARGSGIGTVELADRRQLIVALPPLSNLEPSAPPSQLHVVLGHPRPPVASRLIRDLCAMGVARLSFVTSALSEKTYGHSKLWREGLWQEDLILGMEQGASTWPMAVDLWDSMGQALAGTDPDRHWIALDARGTMGLGQWAEDRGPKALLPVLWIGPERGWTQEELELLSRHGATTCTMGSRILRTETAAIAACSRVLHG